MFAIWPPLILLGSWAGHNLIPLAGGAFLIAHRVVIGCRRSRARRSARARSPTNMW